MFISVCTYKCFLSSSKWDVFLMISSVFHLFCRFSSRLKWMNFRHFVHRRIFKHLFSPLNRLSILVLLVKKKKIYLNLFHPIWLQLNNFLSFNPFNLTSLAYFNRVFQLILNDLVIPVQFMKKLDVSNLSINIKIRMICTRIISHWSCVYVEIFQL